MGFQEYPTKDHTAMIGTPIEVVIIKISLIVATIKMIGATTSLIGALLINTIVQNLTNLPAGSQGQNSQKDHTNLRQAIVITKDQADPEVVLNSNRNLEMFQLMKADIERTGRVQLALIQGISPTKTLVSEERETILLRDLIEKGNRQRKSEWNKLILFSFSSLTSVLKLPIIKSNKPSLTLEFKQK